MKYKLLVTDIDGTLIPHTTQKISRENKEALIELQQRGVKLAIASGRVRQGIEDYAKELRLDEFGGYIICNNGAEIVNYQTKEILYQQTLQPEDVALLFQESIKHNVNVMLMQDEYIIMSGYDEAVHIDHRSVSTDFIWPYDMTPYLTKPTYRMNYTKSPTDLDELERYLKQEYGHLYEFIRPQPIFLDVMSKGVDKSEAVLALTKLLHITMDEVVACGDGGNDLLMVQRAGLGIAVANAFDSVKAVANRVGPNVDDHALAWVINQYMK